MGIFDFKIKPLELRICKNEDCSKHFSVKPYVKKTFCSKSCAAHTNQIGKILSLSHRQNISKAHMLIPHRKFPGRIIRINVKCKRCEKMIKLPPYLAKKQKYCSIDCSIRTTGELTTSPLASKGKNGIRKDVDSQINFYSTWEANIARIYNLVGLEWLYAPKRFDLGEHTYRPDFYLTQFNVYVEVKNFMGPYSLKRDKLFRKRYPKLRLDLILKKEYLEIATEYKELVDNWES